MNVRSALWFATDACNYRCPYCWQQDKPLPKQAGTLEDWLAAWNRLAPDMLDITGGEPFVVPWMLDLMASLDPSIKLAVTTNLSKSVIDLIKRVPPHRLVSVTTSWHPTQRMGLEEFTAKCVLLQKRGYHVVVNYLTWPEQLWITNHFRQWFVNTRLPFHVDKYAPHSEAKALPPNEAERAYAAPLVGPDRGPHPWTKKYGERHRVLCNSGLRHLCVQPDGSIYRCLTWFVAGREPMGSVFDPQLKLLDKPAECDMHDRCAGCDRDKIHCQLIQED